MTYQCTLTPSGVRLNPFVSQVNYYLHPTWCKRTRAAQGLNPFVSQVNYYVMKNHFKKTRFVASQSLRKSGQLLHGAVTGDKAARSTASQSLRKSGQLLLELSFLYQPAVQSLNPFVSQVNYYVELQARYQCTRSLVSIPS